VWSLVVWFCAAALAGRCRLPPSSHEKGTTVKFEEVKNLVTGVPYMTPRQGKILYDFVLNEERQDCLELGFAHGVSSCYIAAALDELGGGHLTAVDLVAGLEWQQPSIDDMLAKTGLQDYVTVVRERTSYTWFLKKALEKHLESPETYDFCFIDGPKNWTIDGFAFFLVDRLLREDGWILFDDYDWRYRNAQKWNVEKFEQTGVMISQMGPDQLDTPHVALIFELLVMTHPDYAEFKVQDDEWAWAHKIAAGRRTLAVEETYPVSTLLKRGIRQAASRLRQ
jgi:predicted O-methyltransferase YrrM